MELKLNGQAFTFSHAPLQFTETNMADVFAKKNNKTLRETIEHRRYSKFTKIIELQYAEFLDYPLGEFLSYLKKIGDLTYRQFLNAYGDGLYCTFSLSNKEDKKQKGIYIYSVNDELVYIGRCRDSFGKRVDMGYGRISAKNCYIDGQATNCHLNHMINQNVDAVKFFYYSSSDNDVISSVERLLIRAYMPSWNIALKGRLATSREK